MASQHTRAGEQPLFGWGPAGFRSHALALMPLSRPQTPACLACHGRRYNFPIGHYNLLMRALKDCSSMEELEDWLSTLGPNGKLVVGKAAAKAAGSGAGHGWLAALGPSLPCAGPWSLRAAMANW